MTTEIEKQFFDTFGIEPKWKSEQCDGWMRTTAVAYFTNLEEAKKFGLVFQEEPEYPQITDRILLELIVIIMFHEDLYGFPRNVKDLKEDVLIQLMETYNEFYNCVTCDGEYQQTAKQIKQQIQALFKEI